MAKQAQTESQTQSSNRRRAVRRVLRNEIGPLPKIKNPKRRRRCRNDFALWCQTYLPHVFFRPFLPDFHGRIAKELEARVLHGGKKAISAPRGSGKSSLIKALFLWILTSHADRHKYLIYLGSVCGATDDAKDFILSNLESNPLLLEDYPEICVPIRAYGGNPQKRITYRNEPVNFRWSGDSIVLPKIRGSEASEVKLQFFSISSKIRGKATNIDGAPWRPSIVAIDDPQSDQSAESRTQVDQMARVVKKAVADLAGYDPVTQKHMEITVVAILTPIALGDLASRLLSRDESPEYNGEIFARLPTMPTRLDLWKAYRQLRIESMNTHGDDRLSREFLYPFHLIL